MKKAEFISVLAEKQEISKAEAERRLSAVLDCIQEVLISGEEVCITGFGKFRISDRKESTAFNPVTKEMVSIPAEKLPVFSAGSKLKTAVNQSTPLK